MIRYDKKADLGLIYWDMVSEGNLWDAKSLRTFSEFVKNALNDDAVTSVIITSENLHFHLGDDIGKLMQLPDAQSIMNFCDSWHSITRAIEKSPKPFIAAINGTALGSGFELCLACHYRIASDDIKMRLGFPQISYGLSIRGGGTQRIPRMLGIHRGTKILLNQRNFTSQEAFDYGLIHNIVPAEKLMETARAWGGSEPEHFSKSWDDKDFRPPGSQIWNPEGMATVTAGNALLHKRTKGNLPAYEAILSSVYEGLQVSIETGLRIESRWFTNVLMGDVAKNMVRTFYFNLEKANTLSCRPKSQPAKKFKTIGIIGTGSMGIEIAYETVRADLEVMLIDVDENHTQAGKGAVTKLLEKEYVNNPPHKTSCCKLVENINTSSTFSDLTEAELIIDTALEDGDVKNEIIANVQANIGSKTIFASSGPLFPISGIASEPLNSEKVIGLHFLPPMDRTKLVEIIVGEKTCEAALCAAMDFVRQIGKTSIVVNNRKGPYASRVFGAYMEEGLALLVNGVEPALIENGGRLAGMPVGPLGLADEVSLELIRKRSLQTKLKLGSAFVSTPGEIIVDCMVGTLGRLGRKFRKGFYEYPENEKEFLWPELSQKLPITSHPIHIGLETVKRRLLYIQSLEAARCLEENVVACPEDADIGSVLGWGFAPHTGGVISMIETIGLATFIHECDQLAQDYGERFKPTAGLRHRAKNQKFFY